MNRILFLSFALLAICGFVFAQTELCADLTNDCEIQACQSACSECTDECVALDFPPATYACSEPFVIVSARDICQPSQPSGDRPMPPSGETPPPLPSGATPLPRPSGEMPPRPSGQMGGRPPRPSIQASA